MATTQRTVLLNSFGLARRERTTSSGTGIRYTVSMEATPMLHVFDAKTLGSGPAAAIAEHLRERIQAIGVRASVATLQKRVSAEAALERGAQWAVERYSGGRTGTKPPRKNGSEMLFNDSGRLAEGIVASPTRDNQWVINFPANRFDPSTFPDGEAGIVKMFVRLRELVPEFGDANAIATVPSVRQAIGDSIDRIFVSGLGRSYGGSSDARARVRALQWDVIRQVFSAGQQLGAF